jgi:hypothetical protein
VGKYAYQATYNSIKYTLGGSPLTGWLLLLLQTHNFNGIDGDYKYRDRYGMLNNRLTAELDLFNKITDGILYRPNVI